MRDHTGARRLPPPCPSGADGATPEGLARALDHVVLGGGHWRRARALLADAARTGTLPAATAPALADAMTAYERAGTYTHDRDTVRRRAGMAARTVPALGAEASDALVRQALLVLIRAAGEHAYIRQAPTELRGVEADLYALLEHPAAAMHWVMPLARGHRSGGSPLAHALLGSVRAPETPAVPARWLRGGRWLLRHLVFVGLPTAHLAALVPVDETEVLLRLARHKDPERHQKFWATFFPALRPAQRAQIRPEHLVPFTLRIAALRDPARRTGPSEQRAVDLEALDLACDAIPCLLADVGVARAYRRHGDGPAAVVAALLNIGTLDECRAAFRELCKRDPRAALTALQDPTHRVRTVATPADVARFFTHADPAIRQAALLALGTLTTADDLPLAEVRRQRPRTDARCQQVLATVYPPPPATGPAWVAGAIPPGEAEAAMRQLIGAVVAGQSADGATFHYDAQLALAHRLRALVSGYAQALDHYLETGHHPAAAAHWDAGAPAAHDPPRPPAPHRG